MRPRDWDECTVEETDALLAWLDAYEEAQREADERLNRGR
jgi:hypothetical protein